VRRCGLHFVLLAAGGVKLRWDCGAEKVIKGETAVDVEILADRTADVGHHHRHHLHHKEAP
jgi:hypothetical protein